MGCLGLRGRLGQRDGNAGCENGRGGESLWHAGGSKTQSLPPWADGRTLSLVGVTQRETGQRGFGSEEKSLKHSLGSPPEPHLSLRAFLFRVHTGQTSVLGQTATCRLKAPHNLSTQKPACGLTGKPGLSVLSQTLEVM